MGGITGFIDHQLQVTEQHLELAAAAIRHRGGNGSGFIFDQKSHYTLGIANERLAIIDLNKLAEQPLTSGCGNYSITFNGTIYNYLEIRETLIKYGVTFSTLTDTEVIIESYKKWGHAAFEKLDGSYAFAILDRKLNQLLIARDDIGAKPLYCYQEKGFYAFASEIKALFAYPTVKKLINKAMIPTFFRYGYFKGEETIYQHITKFKKGYLAIIDIHSGNHYETPLKRRSSYKNTVPVADDTEAQILDKIEELLTESVLKRNVADTPAGILLSGGYDSATVAAILQKNQSKRIKTFTVGFEGKKLDEAPQARKIAEYLKTNHQEFYLDQQSAYAILKKLPDIFEEPIGNSSVIPLLFIAKKVNPHIKVLLSAEGADELFGGYRTYSKAIKYNALDQRKMPKLLKKLLKGILRQTDPKAKNIIKAEGLLNKYLEINACFSYPELDRLIKTDQLLPVQANNKAHNIKDLLLYDLHNYLPNDLLYKNDKCLMHYGVESRDALLKTELVDYLSTLDPSWFIKDGDQKYLLKKITHKYIPANLIEKPQKGFVIPLAAWLKSSFKPLVNEYLTPAKLAAHGLFDAKEAMGIVASFSANPSTYNAQKVWLLLQFQMWYGKWMA